MESSVNPGRPNRKKIKYVPIMTGREELTYTEILSQCVHVLDIASQYATEKADVESLIKLSHDWRELCGYFVEENEEEIDEDLISEPIGFSLGNMEREMERLNGAP